MDWIGFAIIAMIFNTLYVLLFTYLLREQFNKINPIDVITNIFLVLGLAGIGMLIMKKNTQIIFNEPQFRSPKFIFLMVSIIATFAIYAYFMVKSNTETTNPGYTLAIINLNAIFLIIISFILLRQKLEKRAVLGVVLLTIGIALILVTSNNEKNLSMKLLDKYFK